MVTGTLTNNGKALPVSEGKLRGDQITFTAGGAQYTGRVNGNAIELMGPGGATRATRS